MPQTNNRDRFYDLHTNYYLFSVCRVLLQQNSFSHFPNSNLINLKLLFRIILVKRVFKTSLYVF